MNIKRAILFGALLWALIFFEVSILMFGFNIESPSTSYYIIHYILLTFFVIFTSLIYFKKVEPSMKQGFLLGIFLILTSTLLDALITIPLFIKDYSFLLRPDILISILPILIITTLIGTLKKHK